MRKKRIPWSDEGFDYHDVEKYFEFFDLSLRQYYTEVVEKILGPKNIEGKVLDLGCGFGILGMRICSQDEFTTAVGLESSRTLVKAAEVLSSRHGYNSRVTFKVWEEETFPFPDDEFHAVVSFLALHKWNDPEKVLREIERVRKPNSIVYISDFRRDQAAIPFQLFLQQTRFEMGKEIASDLKKSFRSAYSAAEIKQLLDKLGIPDYRLEESKMWLNVISGLPELDEPRQALETEPEIA